jgi:hypothetical protein
MVFFWNFFTNHRIVNFFFNFLMFCHWLASQRDLAHSKNKLATSLNSKKKKLVLKSYQSKIRVENVLNFFLLFSRNSVNFQNIENITPEISVLKFSPFGEKNHTQK